MNLVETFYSAVTLNITNTVAERFLWFPSNSIGKIFDTNNEIAFNFGQKLAELSKTVADVHGFSSWITPQSQLLDMDNPFNASHTKKHAEGFATLHFLRELFGNVLKSFSGAVPKGHALGWLRR